MGGLNFLLRCSYDTKYLNDLPIFYKTILDNFNELKSLYAYNQNQDIILFNNKEILVDGKPIFLREWFNKGIISIVDLLDESGNLLPFQEFSRIYPFETNFLQYYQVISAIPKHLLSKAKESDTFNKNFFFSNDRTFCLNDYVQINFEKVKSRDLYKLFTSKTHTQDQTGPKHWSENLSLT